MIEFRLLNPPRGDLATEIIAALRKAAEIEAAAQEKNEVLVLKDLNLTAEGIQARRNGPTLILCRGGKGGWERFVIYYTGEEFPIFIGPLVGMERATGGQRFLIEDDPHPRRRAKDGKGKPRSKTRKSKRSERP